MLAPVAFAPSRPPKRLSPERKPSGSVESYSKSSSSTLMRFVIPGRLPHGAPARRPPRGGAPGDPPRQRKGRPDMHPGGPPGRPRLQALAVPDDGLVHALAVGGAGGHRPPAAEDQLDHEPHEADQEEDQADGLDRDPGDGGGH